MKRLMRRLALVLLVLAAIATLPVFFGRRSADASPSATITVNSTGDTNARDGVLTLREAMLLATGGLAVGDLDSGECAQVSNSTYGASCSTTDTIGAASADVIVFDTSVFPPGTPATITLGSMLPALSTGSDTVSGAGAGVIVDGVTKSFGCFLIWGEDSDGNTVKGLQINGCSTGVSINYGADNNTVGGATAGDRNIISGNSTGVAIVNQSTTGNMIQGNYIGTDASGSSANPNDYNVAIHIGGQGNSIGSWPRCDGGNLISGNTVDGVTTLGAAVNIGGNLIGTDVTGTAELGNGRYGVRINDGRSTATIGCNVISGNGGDGLALVGSTNGTSVQSNYIGTTVSGTAALGNHGPGVHLGDIAHGNSFFGNDISGNALEGVLIDGGSGNYFGNNSPGLQPNQISNNGSHGVAIVGGRATNNTVGANDIRDNGGSGVSLNEASNNLIGGGRYLGNTISDNTANGIEISGGSGNEVLGNTISGNHGDGVRLWSSSNNLIARVYWVDEPVQTISGNGGSGINIQGNGAAGNQIRENYIYSNGYNGIYLSSGASGNVIGTTSVHEENVVSLNGRDGVRVDGATTTANTITGNSIYANGGKGIANVNGGNTELAPPIVDNLLPSGHTNPKCYPCSVEVFSDSADEGGTYNGSTTANDDATGTWSYSGAVTGPNITATVTDAAGNTSEFSAPLWCDTTDPGADPDGDGLTNSQEPALGTDPCDGDTDGDGMPDGYKVAHACLNPLVADAESRLGR